MVKRYWAAAATDIETAPCLVEGWVPVHLSSDYDALAAELAQTKKALAIVQDTSVAHAGKQNDRLRELEAALEPFRHTRVRHDELNEYVFTDLLDGIVCVVAYVRNGEMADDFNERFERARTALEGKP